MSFIKLENVTKEYITGTTVIKALDDVNFEIESGKFTVILGPSGSGKSTILNLIGGMDYCSKGKITVGKRTVSELSDKQLTVYRRHDIGFVFQFYNLMPNLTAFENVDISSHLSKTPMTAKEAIEAVGLLERMNNFPSQMSGGELQRVSIARALCKNPKVLLCDEPTGALDSQTGQKVLTLLQKVSKEYDSAVIVVTHNAAIAPAADRVIRLRDGKVESITDNDNAIAMEEVDW